MTYPTFLLSFLTRYWRLLVVFVALVAAGRVDQITYFVGPLFYLIELGVGTMVVTLLLKHMAFKYTVDAFTENQPNGSSEFVATWNALPAPEKLKLTIYLVIALFLGVSFIAASIAK